MPAEAQIVSPPGEEARAWACAASAGWNWMGLQTLAVRETRRFLAVWTQTLAAPLVTAGLFLAIFTLAIGPARGPR
jgi:hypothetical protein